MLALDVPFFTNGTKYNDDSCNDTTESKRIEKEGSTIAVTLAGSSKP